jgi:hypothetical protein
MDSNEEKHGGSSSSKGKNMCLLLIIGFDYILLFCIIILFQFIQKKRSQKEECT